MAGLTGYRYELLSSGQERPYGPEVDRFVLTFDEPVSRADALFYAHLERTFRDRPTNTHRDMMEKYLAGEPIVVLERGQGTITAALDATTGREWLFTLKRDWND